MSYLLSFSLLEANTNDKATYHAMRAGGSLVGESILSRYDRHLILQEIRLHSWSVIFKRETGQTPLVQAVGLEPTEPWA